MRLPLSSQQIQNNILNIYIVQASSICKGSIEGKFRPFLPGYDKALLLHFQFI
jgi:hypothetical protein